MSAAQPAPDAEAFPSTTALPSGTVTFVFTDIEGSTQRWDRDRDAMQSAVRRHDELMHAAIAAHGGYVFKTIGDAFCAAFARPEDAVAAVHDAELALAAEDFSAVGGLNVRAAIHTGTADERGRDYYGPAVNRVARLLAIGHGGQVLVSGVTADLVQGALPPKASLRDLGEHRLRDLSRPEYVYQLLVPGLVHDFEPLRSLDTLPNNLPLQLKSFVGREREIAEITELIETHRLVTLVGSGGVGKTRTSLQVAANLLDGSGDGVWFIELAPLLSGDYIPAAVAQALGIALPAEGTPLENLLGALKGKHALLIFDNCEHMVEPAAAVIAAILRSCPHIRILASSRQGLGIEGEDTYRMPSLGIPGDSEAGDITVEQAMTSTAVALFVERARAVNKRFALTDENASAVVEICRRLDGIPLAIELAAARVQILSPRQLHERLDERFRVLTGGSRDVLPRQQTLRALIDWSHDLLDERERTLFRRLGIFVKSFALEGATAVGIGTDLDELDVFDVLASLVSKSLVLAEPFGDSLRYRLLESSRVYALEKLDEARERTMVAEAHLCYLRDLFVALAERYERTGRVAELHLATARELEDVRSALDSALGTSDVRDGARLLAAIRSGWRHAAGLGSEGMARCEAYLAALPADETTLRALLSIHMSTFLNYSVQKARSATVAASAVEYARKSGDVPVLADALARYAYQTSVMNRIDEARAAIAEAESLPGVPLSVRLLLLQARAVLAGASGDTETEARLSAQFREEHRALGNTDIECIAALNLAEAEYALGKTQQAIATVREALPSARSLIDRGLLRLCLINLSGYLVAVDDLSGAVGSARESLALYGDSGSGPVHVAIQSEHLALVFALRGELTRAATLKGFVEATYERYGFAREATESRTQERLDGLLHEGLSIEELSRLMAAGATLTPEAVITLAMADPTA